MLAGFKKMLGNVPIVFSSLEPVIDVLLFRHYQYSRSFGLNLRLFSIKSTLRPRPQTSLKKSGLGSVRTFTLAPEHYLKEDGVLLIASACSLGMGHHGLLGPNQSLYRKPMAKGLLKQRQLAAFMPGVTSE